MSASATDIPPSANDLPSRWPISAWGVVAVGVAAALLGAASAMWFVYGGALFFEAIAAGFAACF